MIHNLKQTNRHSQIQLNHVIHSTKFDPTTILLIFTINNTCRTKNLGLNSSILLSFVGLNTLYKLPLKRIINTVTITTPKIIKPIQKNSQFKSFHGLSRCTLQMNYRSTTKTPKKNQQSMIEIAKTQMLRSRTYQQKQTN